MKKTAEQLLITKSDYAIIIQNLKNRFGASRFNRTDAEELKAELQKAKLVDEQEIPTDVVRLNSQVTIQDEKDKKLIQVMIVTPEKADIKKRKISIMSPLGTALMGYRKGKKIRWQVPAGKRTFTILDVSNLFGQEFAV